MVCGLCCFVQVLITPIQLSHNLLASSVKHSSFSQCPLACAALQGNCKLQLNQQAMFYFVSWWWVVLWGEHVNGRCLGVCGVLPFCASGCAQIGTHSPH